MKRDAKRLKHDRSQSFNLIPIFISRVKTCAILNTDFMVLKNVSILESLSIYQSRRNISESCVICV